MIMINFKYKIKSEMKEKMKLDKLFFRVGLFQVKGYDIIIIYLVERIYVCILIRYYFEY